MVLLGYLTPIVNMISICCMYYPFISRISYAVLNLLHIPSGEQGMVDEAQKALEEAEALKKVFNF